MQRLRRAARPDPNPIQTPVPQTLLVTGGLGFIGSHTCVSLAEAGYEIVVIDNLYNCKRSVLDRVVRIAGRPVEFHELDIRDEPGLARLFAAHRFAGVIHFAGLKAVGESVAEPLKYFDNNVRGTVSLLKAMTAHGVKSMVFSSSCTVYGDPASVPVREDFPLRTTNPYGRTKLILEDMLRDVHAADPLWRIALLRYFNPVGAHASGTIGEEPSGTPNNLVPYIAQVATGEREFLRVFGNDYPTVDGTGVRDYIHVVDLAEGHVAAQRYLEREGGLATVNLGTGGGCSVLQMVAAFEHASGRPIPYRIEGRRPGDVAATFGDVSRAKTLLGWSAKRGIGEICADAWRWQQWTKTNA
jgi:UDP-glucose 4-epimerase